MGMGGTAIHAQSVNDMASKARAEPGLLPALATPGTDLCWEETER